MIPNLSKRIEKLQKKDIDVINDHLKNAKMIIQRKQDIFEGKIEELGEKIKRTKDELKQLNKLIDEVEGKIDPQISLLLLSIEVNIREFQKILEQELKIVKDFEKGSNKIDFVASAEK